MAPARTNVPARFFARVTIHPGDELRVEEAAPPVAQWPSGGENFTAVLRDEGVWHYFHFMETMIWLWVIQHEFLGAAPLRRIVFTRQWDNHTQNHVQIAVIRAIYPGIDIIDRQLASSISLDNVLVLDRSWTETKLNKFVEDCVTYGRPWVTRLGRLVRQSAGAHGGRPGSNRFLYVWRPPPRCLEPAAEQGLLALLQRRGPTNVVDFAAIPWEQQVRLVAAHDVLVGVHGNGLTNALWMRPGSLLLEIFPPNAHHYDYQFFAELCGLQYFGFEGDNVFPAFVRAGPPYGHGRASNAPVPIAPLANIEYLLDARQQRA